MIKRLKPVMILAGVAAVLGIVLWVLIAFVLPKDEAGDEKGNEVPLIEAALTEADSLEIRNTFDHYKLVKAAIGSYYVEGKKDLPVDSESVIGLLEKIGSLTAVKKVIDHPSEEQLESYGLINPYGTVTVKNGDQTYSFTLGTTSASGNYYCKMAGQETVYLIKTTVPDQVLLARYQFYQDTMISYSDDSNLETLTPVIIGGKRRAQTIRLEMNELGDEEVGTNYVLTEPIYQSFASAMEDDLTELLTALTSATIVGDDVSDSALRALGLTDPDYTLTFTLDGKTETVRFGNVTDSDMQYCYTEGGKFVHSVSITYTDMLGAPLKNYCEDMIYTRAYDVLRTIKITGSGKTYTIQLGDKDENGDFPVQINGKAVDDALFSDFYAHVLTIGITDMGERGSAAEPRVTVEFALKSGVVETLRFYPVSELKCFVDLNGSGQFWVSTLSVDKILENAQRLYNGEVITNEW